MKRKGLVITGMVVSMALASAFTSFAGEWVIDQNPTTYKNETKYLEDDGTYVVNTWKWIDSEYDEIAESYYFDSNGHKLSNTVIDGYQLNEQGQWVVDGVVQTKENAGPYSNDSLYIQMRDSAFAKLATVDFNQDSFELSLTDVVYEQNAHNKNIVNYLALKILYYSKNQNSKFYSVSTSSMMADNVLFQNSWNPVFTVKIDINIYANDPVYIQQRDAAFAQLSSADLSQKFLEIDLIGVATKDARLGKMATYIRKEVITQLETQYNKDISYCMQEICDTDSGDSYIYIRIRIKE